MSSPFLQSTRAPRFQSPSQPERAARVAVVGAALNGIDVHGIMTVSIWQFAAGADRDLPLFSLSMCRPTAKSKIILSCFVPHQAILLLGA
jgi:hypothetical protein